MQKEQPTAMTAGDTDANYGHQLCHLPDCPLQPVTPADEHEKQFRMRWVLPRISLPSHEHEENGIARVLLHLSVKVYRQSCVCRVSSIKSSDGSPAVQPSFPRQRRDDINRDSVSLQRANAI